MGMQDLAIVVQGHKRAGADRCSGPLFGALRVTHKLTQYKAAEGNYSRRLGLPIACG